MPSPLLASLLLAAHVTVAGTAATRARPAHARPRAAAPQEMRVIRGEVLDATTGLPLSGSTVVLRLAGEGMLTPAHAGSSFLATGRAVTTDADGAYRFAELPAGRYQLHVQRLGYRPASVEVELRAEASSNLSVGLSVAPIRLTALVVHGEAKGQFQVRGPELRVGDSPRIRTVRDRQHRYASTDVREVTEADLMEAVTLGETDLFRALHRLPGVTPRNDHSAELWTRGTRWDRTRVYLDGLPLFAPLHNYGELTGIGTDIVGSAVLFPGVAPASIAEGSAALDLRSRTAEPDGDLRGVAELTVLNARLALARGDKDGSGGWSIAGRRRFRDLISRAVALEQRAAYSGEYYDDLTGSWEQALPGGRRLEASALFSRDRQEAPVSDTLGNLPLDAHNLAARLTLVAPAGRWTTRHTVGASRYAARRRYKYLNYLLSPPALSAPYGTDATVQYVALTGEVAPTTEERTSGDWRAGWSLSEQRAELSGQVAAELLRDTTHLATTRFAKLPMLGLWGEQRWTPRAWLRVDGGLRVDLGRAIASAGGARLAPRVQARAALDSQTAFSVAIGRSFQYAQALTRHATTTPETYVSKHFWVLADEQTPALQSDVVTAGAERWVGGAVLLGASAYVRRASGVAVPDPAPGPLMARPLVQMARERAQGLELSARKLAGRATGMVAYTLASSRTIAGGFEYPSAQDRLQSIDATLLLRATSRLQLGAAYAQMSGVPYTMNYRMLGSPGESWEELGMPNAHRAPGTWNVDLLADWSGKTWGAQTNVFLQVRSLFGRRGPHSFTSSRPCTDDGVIVPGCSTSDYYQTRVSPFDPVLGVRLAF